MTQHNVTVTQLSVMCRRCGDQPATIPKHRAHPIYCRRCWGMLPCNQRAYRRYRDAHPDPNPRRLMIGHRYVGMARTAAEAQRINDYIKRRVAVFQQTKGDAKCSLVTHGKSKS